MRKANMTLTVLLISTACSSSGPEWTGTVTDSAGIAIVANTAEGLWPDGAEWTLEEELRIGTVDGAAEYQFGEIAWLAPGSDGSLYVLDAQGQHVNVYSPGGEYLRTIGSPGNGPGEVGTLTVGQAFVLLGPGDTVLVPDNVNQRVNRWTASGESVGSFRIDFTRGIPFTWTVTPSGALAEQVRPVNFTGSTDASQEQRDFILRLGTDGVVLDTVMSFPSGKSFSFAGGLPEWTIFTPETSWSITETDHVLLGTSDEYRLREYDPAGTLTRIVSMPFEVRPVSDRDKQAVREYFRKILGAQPGVPPAVVEQLVANNVHFGEFLPAFGRVVAGPNGTMWVQHVRSAAGMTDEQLAAANFIEDVGAPDWDVIDRDGRYLGVVTMPDRFTPRVIVGWKVYGVWRDDVDVQYAMVLNVVGAEVD